MNAVREIMTLPIASIAIPARRIGFYNDAHATRLGLSMARDGQIDPIHVQDNGGGVWTLVAGLHRLRGLERSGASEVAAIQVADSSASAAELERLELSENIDHQRRRPIELAIFMTHLARIEEARDHPGHVGESPQARGGRMKAAGITMIQADWKQRTADALGCSAVTLKRYQRIYRNIVEALPDVAERINFHPLCDSFSAVNAFAKRESLAERQRIAAALFDGTEWPTMEAVLVAAGVKLSTGARDDPRQPDATFMSALAKMKGPRRRVTLLALAAELTAGEVLGMVEVFKERRIIGDNAKTA